MSDLRRELAAELLGTFVLIAFGVGVVAQVVLGANAHGTYLSINVAWGLAVMLGVLVAGGVSGAHLNPAVTVAMAVHRGLPWRRVLPYSLAQLVLAFLAAAVVFVTYREAFTAFDSGVRQIAGAQATAGVFAGHGHVGARRGECALRCSPFSATEPQRPSTIYAAQRQHALDRRRHKPDQPPLRAGIGLRASSSSSPARANRARTCGAIAANTSATSAALINMELNNATGPHDAAVDLDRSTDDVALFRCRMMMRRVDGTTPGHANARAWARCLELKHRLHAGYLTCRVSRYFRTNGSAVPL